MVISYQNKMKVQNPRYILICYLGMTTCLGHHSFHTSESGSQRKKILIVRLEYIFFGISCLKASTDKANSQTEILLF